MLLLFTSDGYPATRSLKGLRRQNDLAPLRIDVHASERAESIHADLGRNHLGTLATRATPTIIVGIRVLRGDNPEKVLRAISEQKER